MPVIFFAFIINWSVIIFELTLFGAFFMPPKRRVFLLLPALCFHFLILVLHGLVSFFFSAAGLLIIYLYNRYYIFNSYEANQATTGTPRSENASYMEFVAVRPFTDDDLPFSRQGNYGGFFFSPFADTCRHLCFDCGIDLFHSTARKFLQIFITTFSAGIPLTPEGSACPSTIVPPSGVRGTVDG